MSSFYVQKAHTPKANIQLLSIHEHTHAHVKNYRDLGLMSFYAFVPQQVTRLTTLTHTSAVNTQSCLISI